MRGTRTWLASVAVLLIAGAAGAQEFRGRIQGVVSDTTGGVLPGTSVVLTNDQTGVEVTRIVNREGRYIIDYVDPGTYTLTVSLDGFKTGVHKNILVQQRGDVTVDVKLEVGGLEETITVTRPPVAIEFNTTSHDLTVEQKMVRDLPVNTRNPFQLALLDPVTLNRGSTVETQPYHHRTANEMDIGGGTKYRNDILLDGTPLIAGNKLGYTPPMDAVTEYTIQQNAIDAEFGHSAGGIAVVTMKSGSNDVHGTGYYYGRSSGLNATSDRALHIHSDNPYWNAGGTIGMPLRKNKLFLFAVFERIENTQSSALGYTLPTALERQGDFSQSFNADGSLRVIYDPLTSRLVNGQMVRDPFPGNRIPRERFDPLATKILGGLWNPNNAGDDRTGFNNFKYQQELQFHYYNFSTRLDWQLNDRWKAYARVSRMKTDQDAPDYTGGNDPLKLRNITGSKRNGWNIAADTVYSLNPSTTLDVRGSFYQAEDKRDYPDMAIGEAGMQNLWPSGWWQPYMAERPLVYSPYLVVDTAARAQFGVQNFWYQQPKGYSAHARLSKYLGNHTLKAGTEVRWKRGDAARYYYADLRFVARETGNVWLSPNTRTGHPWASFLLGALDPNVASTTTGIANSNVRYNPPQTANTEMYAGYVQDDFRINKTLTLNLGLRYEYQGGLWDPQNRLPQRLDLTQAIPGLQAAIDPRIPADIKAKMAQSTGRNSYIYNGAFYFTDSSNNRKTDASTMNFMPRVGLAWRADDKTAVRAGYGRFIVPTDLANPERDTLGEIDLAAYSPITSALPMLNGVPQAFLNNPFPQGLTAPYGQQYGVYTNLGDTITIDQYQQKTPVSDRISLSVQRELPGRIVADVTYLINFVSHDQYSQNLNLMDPRLRYTYGTAIDQPVANPFYNYGTVATFPGALRRQATIATSDLLRPYPQYGDIIQTGTDLRKARYQSLQFRVQRPYSKGVSFLVAYAYVTQKSQWFFDPQDEYDGALTWMDFSVTQAGRTGAPTVIADPKHRVAAAATFDIPVGKGRRLGSQMSSALDAVLGGWQVSGLFNYTSGLPLVFTAAMIAPASVHKLGQVGTSEYWFDVAGFARQPANTRRTNPWYFDGLTGPDYKNVDLGLSKNFTLNSRMKLQFRVDAYNALNGMNWANPTLTITASDFGKTNTQATGYYGRQIQYSARLIF